MGGGFTVTHGASLKINNSCDSISFSLKRPRSPAFTGITYICEASMNFFNEKKKILHKIE